MSHSGERPTSFILRRAGATAPPGPAGTPNDPGGDKYDGDSAQDLRRRVLRALAVPSGQPKFRAELLAAHRGRCAITGCDVEGVLEAAHIHPYRWDLSYEVTNGILLAPTSITCSRPSCSASTRTAVSW